ncbi:MAG TPA: TetR/AcrR family transcriptional regulator [Actinobacteria bacterium]|jgi:AcrR family transcriptional regulator|nr:TetR/AcrR family transcriptional regulator [Actinomycetota bacterium]
MIQKEKSETRERIIKAVLKIIGQKGTVKFTVREISKVANVNLSAVNYYFRSTSNLLNEVEIYFAEKVQEVSSILGKEDSYTKLTLIEWAKAMMELLSKNTGIIWIIAKKILNKGSPGIFIEKLIDENGVFLKKIISKLTNSNDDQFLAEKVTQLISGISFPIIISKGLGKDIGQNFNDFTVIDRYASSVVSSILK